MMFLSLVTTLLISQPSSAAARVVVPAPYGLKDIVEALRTQTPIAQRYSDGGRLLISGDLEVDLGVAEAGARARAQDVLAGHPVGDIHVALAPGARVRLVDPAAPVRAPGPTTDSTWIGDNVQIVGSPELAEQIKAWVGTGGTGRLHTGELIKQLYEFLNEPVLRKPDLDPVTLTVNPGLNRLPFLAYGTIDDEILEDPHVKALLDRLASPPLPPCAKPLGDDSSGA